MNNSSKLPIIFLSHGSPTLALEDSAAGRFLDALGPSLPRPKAVVVASAHFMTDRPMLGGNPTPHTVHDFGGFPEPLYQIQYKAPGDPTLANDIAKTLDELGAQSKVRPEHGIDHGVWVPLLRMYPDADIPVVPLSVMPYQNAKTHYQIGLALGKLRDQGVLVIGSGGFVHNLGELEWRNKAAPMPEWAQQFRQWMLDKLFSGDIEALLAWHEHAPNPDRAHPTVEHLMPFYVALGAAAGAQANTVKHIHNSHEYGSLALDAFAFE